MKYDYIEKKLWMVYIISTAVNSSWDAVPLLPSQELFTATISYEQILVEHS